MKTIISQLHKNSFSRTIFQFKIFSTRKAISINKYNNFFKFSLRKNYTDKNTPITEDIISPDNKSNEKNLNLNIFLEKCKMNQYKGIEINLEDCNMEISSLSEMDLNRIIQHSILEWNKIEVRSITITIPLNLTKFIKSFTDEKFYFHHTTEDTLTVCRWLDKTTPNKIPKYAHHHIGVGACIFNQKMEILLIREKYSIINKKKNQPLWKLVTGLVEEGENLIEATYREAREEVNLEINYHGCVMISERFPDKFNLTDLCFFSLCSLKSKEEFSEIEIDKSELTEAKFFNLKEIENILDEKMCTLATENTLNKILPWMDFNLTFDENLKKIEESRKSLMVRNEYKDKKLKFLYMFM